ncbi:hypothetical protein, partial [Polymorphobacter multimanifer]|uniref:hypothetical protein n=1 Tax=Polymorphobacter multimanifer TaxID=1070431 RepID=UPI001A9C8E9C
AQVADVRKNGHVAQMEPRDSIEQKHVGGVGCAWTMLAVNVAIIGLLTASMVQGPYSSPEQELWYRYGSLGFLIAGVGLPAFVLVAIRRSRSVVVSATAWMVAILLAFVWYGAMSSGGV